MSPLGYGAVREVAAYLVIPSERLRRPLNASVRGRMDSFLPLVALLLFWRTAVASAVAFVLAMALAAHVSWFTGGHGLAVVLVAFGAGLLWESSARPRGAERTTAAAAKLSAPVATLALAFFGAIAGAWAGAAAGSLAAGALARAFAWGSSAYSAASLLLGFGCVAVLGGVACVRRPLNPCTGRKTSVVRRTPIDAVHVERQSHEVHKLQGSSINGRPHLLWNRGVHWRTFF